LRLAEDSRTNIVDIARLVERDPPLATRFLAIAGSAVHARGAKVTSVHTALVRIGLAAARDLLLQAVYERSTSEVSCYRTEVAACFEHCVRTAIVARCVAREARLSYDYAYLCGLLHDIGEASIYRILATMPDAPRSGHGLEDLVARYHAQAGATVARAWRLPLEIADVCARHHDVSENVAPQVRVTAAADALVSFMGRCDGAPEASQLTDSDTRMLRRAGVDSPRFPILLTEVAACLDQARETSEG
jgi:putative nucleotidyltransferase with HDIG domain